jgi:spermidine/putrescine transport system permease protein
LLFVLPLGVLMAVSFGERTTYGGVRYALSLSNYLRAFEPLYLLIFARSLALAVLTTAICLLIGYPVAYWLGQKVRPERRNLLLALVIMPFWTALLIRMYAWAFLLQTEGLINTWLEQLGLIATPLPLLYNFFAVLLGQVYGELPFMILALYASLEKLDPALLEAAADLGASAVERFLRVMLPLTREGILAGSTLVFIPSLGAFIAPDILGGARTMVAGTLIQSQISFVRDIPFGAAISWLLTLPVLALLLVLRRGRQP